MPSTFTTNTGIEKPGNGEQSGSWGTTVNTNMDILDRTVNGVVSLTLTGTSSTITTANGATSDGQYKVLLLGGVLSATHTITVNPADAQKIYYVKNSTGQTVVFTQGAGTLTASVPNGGFGIVFADGSDECVNLTDSSSVSSLILGGTAVTATGAELNVIDGNTNAVSTTVTGSDSIVFNDNGVMKQVSMSDINTYIQSQVSQPTVNNNTITITAGDVLTGGGTFTTNGGATSITLNHQDVSSQGSSNNSGNTFIQDVTLDNYGHVTGLGTATVATSSAGPEYIYQGGLQTLYPGDTAILRSIGTGSGNSYGFILYRNGNANDRLINANGIPGSTKTYTNNTGSNITGVGASVNGTYGFFFFIDRA